LFIEIDTLSSLVLSLVDPARRDGWQTHAVADEDDDVLGQVGVDVRAALQTLPDRSSTELQPVF
jgi:hypothetical protein